MLASINSKNKVQNQLKNTSENNIIDITKYLSEDAPIMHVEPEKVEPKIEVKYCKNGEPKKTHYTKSDKKKEVYAYKTVEDIKGITEYFLNTKKYIHFLVFTVQFNLARRIGDVLKLSWNHFFYPDGTFKEQTATIKEEKTGKTIKLKVNNGIKEAVDIYIEKIGVDPSENNYSNPVFLQLTGTYKGRVLGDEAHRKALKKAAEAVGITYHIGTHSARKSYGLWSRKLHPTDPNSMQILRLTFNHENENDTSRYIGLSKEKMDEYMDDMGDFWCKHIMGNEQYVNKESSPITSLDANDLRDIITLVYTEGKNNANCTDAETHLEAMNTIMEMIDDLAI